MWPVDPKAPWHGLPAPVRWLVQHEGLPLRGGAAADLPAALREVAEAACYSNTTPEFLLASRPSY